MILFLEPISYSFDEGSITIVYKKYSHLLLYQILWNILYASFLFLIIIYTKIQEILDNMC